MCQGHSSALFRVNPPLIVIFKKIGIIPCFMFSQDDDDGEGDGANEMVFDDDDADDDANSNGEAPPPLVDAESESSGGDSDDESEESSSEDDGDVVQKDNYVWVEVPEVVTDSRTQPKSPMSLTGMDVHTIAGESLLAFVSCVNR